jgi:preprotein translocase subunit SecE
MKKVTWPTKKETYNYTILVIGISLAVAAFLGALDYIFSLGIKFII